MVTKKVTLLSVAARNKCKEISQGKEGLASKRALALLAVDQGESQEQAAKSAGLTSGQVKYAIELFRKKNLALFPQELPKKKVLTVPKAASGQVTKINLKEIADRPKKEKAEEKKAKKEKGKEKTESEKKVKKAQKAEAEKIKDKKKSKKEEKKKKKDDKGEKKEKKSSKKKSAKKKEKGKKSKKK
jgi:hypothetical protein